MLHKSISVIWRIFYLLRIRLFFIYTWGRFSGRSISFSFCILSRSLYFRLSFITPFLLFLFNPNSFFFLFIFIRTLFQVFHPLFKFFIFKGLKFRVKSLIISIIFERLSKSCSFFVIWISILFPILLIWQRYFVGLTLKPLCLTTFHILFSFLWFSLVRHTLPYFCLFKILVCHLMKAIVAQIVNRIRILRIILILFLTVWQGWNIASKKIWFIACFLYLLSCERPVPLRR